MKLEEIAVELKQRCSDDQGKMQSLLPELLETHGVPTFTLTPVYNPRSAAYMYVAYMYVADCVYIYNTCVLFDLHLIPILRIRLGNLRPNKCKIMGSKKVNIIILPI